MNKLKSSWFLMLLLLVSCQKKSLPVITDRQTEPVAKTVFTYPPRETVAPDTLEGKRIFTNRCGRCHALPLPVQYTATRWDRILPTMMPRARMNNEEALHVRTWIMAHVKPQ